MPSLVPSPSAPRPPPHHHHHPPPMLLGGHVTLSALIGALRPFTHVRFFRRICQHSQPFPLRTAAYIVGAEPFPGLIKAKRVFQFRVIERVQHINMLGQHYQPVSLLRVIDDGPSTLAPTNILSGCVFFFCLIGSFAARIPTYLMLMMKSQESWGDSCKLNVHACRLHSYAGQNCYPSI